MAQIRLLATETSETWKSKTECESAELKYIVTGTNDKQEAIALVFDAAPPTYGGLSRGTVRFDEVTGNTEVVSMTLSVSYAKDDENSGEGGSADDNSEEEPTISLDCSAENVRITRPIRQVCVYAAEGSGYEVGNEYNDIPIGWNGKTGQENEADGVESAHGVLRVTFTKAMRPSKIQSIDWMLNCAAMVGCSNEKKFYGFEPKTLLFHGCSYQGELNGRDKIVVTFHFGVMPHEKNAVVSGHAIGDKVGTDRIWALTDSVVDGEKIYPSTKAIFSAQVVYFDNFKKLGL